ncbi:MAG: MTAP family purine nucleoside phosphorylase [Fimbriimonadaceae bacterium]|nr:MTAP family purine nucleoside phosphorylase [Fimbriimonadaceae bacterium]
MPEAEIKIGLIGGTGVGSRLQSMGGQSLLVPTPYGPMRGLIQSRSGYRAVVVARHSTGHKTPPHDVNYRAIAWGLKSLGVRGVFSTAAVGSLRTDWGPGTLAVCNDMIDMTYRNLTMFERGVKHVDVSSPFPAHPSLAASVAKCTGGEVRFGTYLGSNGPRYETPSEIRMMQSWGGDVVGMTASSEAIAMAETGVPYACLAVVTNLGCGLAGGDLNHEEVVDIMDQQGDLIVRILDEAARTQLER